MQIYILTIPRTVHKKILKLMIKENDCKKWIIAREVGENGYQHYQIRLETSNKGFFLWVKKNIPSAHVEKGSTDNFDYERKEGDYWCSYDTSDIRKVRFGNLYPLQKRILRTVRNQSDREIDVWLDPHGAHGKTFLSIYLWERRQALVVPRSCGSADRIIQFVCSAYKNETYIIIDIPRSSKIRPDWYEAIEELKDGLVYDTRYSGRARNIRGVKIIIFTNTPLDTKRLSKDRWRLHGINEGESPLS